MMELLRWVGLMLYYAVKTYYWILIIYIIASWFIPDRRHPAFVFLAGLCEPPMRFFQRITHNRLVIGPVDLSPILLFFCLILLEAAIIALFPI